MRGNISLYLLRIRYLHHLSIIYPLRHALLFSPAGHFSHYPSAQPKETLLHQVAQIPGEKQNSLSSTVPRTNLPNIFLASHLISSTTCTAFLTYPRIYHDNFKGTCISTQVIKSLSFRRDHSRTKYIISCKAC